MMNQSPNRNIWTAAAASALFMITLGITPHANAAQAEHLSQKEVKELIASAKEPQDHLRLAHYYNDEASQLEATANEHAAMEEVYRKTQGIHNLGAATQTVGHCEYFVKSMREAAKADHELAAEHEQMAKDAAIPAK